MSLISKTDKNWFGTGTQKMMTRYILSEKDKDNLKQKNVKSEKKANEGSNNQLCVALHGASANRHALVQNFPANLLQDCRSCESSGQT